MIGVASPSSACLSLLKAFLLLATFLTFFLEAPELSAAATARLAAPVLSAPLFAPYSSPYHDMEAKETGEPAPAPPFPASREDWEGVWLDTGVLLGSQFVAVGIIYLMPESVSGWSREQKRDGVKKYHKNVGHLAVDRDKFYLNYILHPYWGAAYYTRARERGLSEGAAVAFSAGASAMYEFGVEAFFERPSIQDLIVTPLGGSLLGAYLFEPLRESIRRKEVRQWYHDALMVLTDPVGVLSTGVERLTGRKPELRLEYAPPDVNGSSFSPTRSGSSLGVTLSFPLE